MSKPKLENDDLDAIISSDDHGPGVKAPEKETKSTKNKAQGKSNFPTFSELSTRKIGVTKTASVVESSTIDSKQLLDSAVGSFGDQTLEMIIGNDDRKRVPDPMLSPWRKIAALIITSQSGSQYAGTGWFISPRVLVTAGHCVYLHDAGGFAREIEVIPCWNNSNKPFGQQTAKLFKSSNGWVNDRNSDFDYGLIVLDKAADARIGYFSFAAAADEYLNGKIVNVCGYPHDPDKWPNQYYHAREITRASEHKIYYDADSTGGQSGAGLWLNLGEEDRVAVGIHTTGSSTTNYGTRITKAMFNNFKEIKDGYQ